MENNCVRACQALVSIFNIMEKGNISKQRETLPYQTVIDFITDSKELMSCKGNTFNTQIPIIVNSLQKLEDKGIFMYNIADRKNEKFITTLLDIQKSTPN